jgi:outer membrane lipoprotein-sorting protein
MRACTASIEGNQVMMKRRILATACAALIAAPLAWGAEEPVAARLPVEQIVAKNAAARGGLTAWRAVKAMTVVGQLDAGGKTDARLPFTMSMQRPHKSRLEIRFQDQTAVQVYDGKQGWKVRPFLNRNEVEPYTPAEARLASEWDELDGPLLDHARKGTRVELAGVEDVNGKSAYKLRLTTKSGAQRHVWVDSASFLDVKIDGEPRKLDGRPRKVAVYMRDYKSVGGLMVAHELETVVEGVKSARKMTFQSVKIDPVLEATAFAKPRLQGQVAAR